MAFPSVTYTFVNGATADASQVNQNFTDLVNALTDGSGDLTIGSLNTAALVRLGTTLAVGAFTDDSMYQFDVGNGDHNAARLQPTTIVLGTGPLGDPTGVISLDTVVYGGDHSVFIGAGASVGSGGNKIYAYDVATYLCMFCGTATQAGVVFGQYQSGGVGADVDPDDTLSWLAAQGAGLKADLYSGTDSWQDYFSSSTIVGWDVDVTGEIYYKRVGKTVFVTFYIYGTSNDTVATFTLPYNTGITMRAVCRGFDDTNTDVAAAPMFMLAGGAVVTVAKDQTTGAWTASGNKIVRGQFWYQIE